SLHGCSPFFPVRDTWREPSEQRTQQARLAFLTCDSNNVTAVRRSRRNEKSPGARSSGARGSTVTGLSIVRDLIRKPVSTFRDPALVAALRRRLRQQLLRLERTHLVRAAARRRRIPRRGGGVAVSVVTVARAHSRLRAGRACAGQQCRAGNGCEHESCHLVFLSFSSVVLHPRQSTAQESAPAFAMKTRARTAPFLQTI